MEISAQVIARCRDHDPAAFETVYRASYRSLLGVAMRYTRSREEAEDVLQDAYIRIFNAMASYSGKGSFEGWMKRVVQNTAINHYRSRLRENTLYVEKDHGADQADDGFEALVTRLENKEIIELLNQMPDGYRMVINLYCIDGYSHQEIAVMLNISEGTSKSQLHKARAYLSGMLTEAKWKII